jgi:hypothetical protein
LPEVDEDIWWCSLFNITVEPAGVEAAEPILIVFPTRRTLTPGLPVFNFIQVPDGEWQGVDPEADKSSSPKTEITLPYAFQGNVAIGGIGPLPPPGGGVGGNGNGYFTYYYFNYQSFYYLGGVRAQDRALGISDGTSNTIFGDGSVRVGEGIEALLPYIEQDN